MSTAGLDRIVGPEANGAVMSAEVCRLLIEAGEKTGFKMAKDSIDSNPAMDISVYGVLWLPWPLCLLTRLYFA